jgi:ABC-2 type transport system ATP-binding protein
VFAVHAEGLVKTYAGPLGRAVRPALRGVDLAIPCGAAFGLIGPNGAGKTSFVKVLLGIVRPTSGRIRLLGGDPEDPRTRARVGYLPERLSLPPAWNAIEVLASVARLKRLSRATREIALLLERVGLARDAHRKVSTFSKGMRQRVGIAAALLGRPDLLVLDEPTDGLDPLARVEVRALLAGELARGATLLLNSHLLAETERICGRIGVLVDGRVAREGPLAQLCAPRQRWVARFAPGADPAALSAAGFVSEGDAWAFDGAGPEELNRALDAARASGALVVDLARPSQDLEKVLAEAVERAA